MSSDVRQRLKRLLTEYAACGAGPFEIRVRKRALRAAALTDMDLRHNLLNAYGPLLEDLDRLGLGRFYRMDLAAVIGQDRVERVLNARYAPAPAPPNRAQPRDLRWVLGGVSSMLVASGVMGFGGMKDEVGREMVEFGLVTPVWSAIYQADQTPAALQRAMRNRTIEHLAALPVGSDMWWALKEDPAVSVTVRDRMERDLLARNRDALERAGTAVEAHRP
jgi:hypothetical protein